MICYVCPRNAEHRIYDDLKPVCNVHLVEAVNEEGGDLVISTLEAHDTERSQKINNYFGHIDNYLRKLHDIRKGSLKYGLSDLSDWLDTDLDRVCVLLDELQYEVNEGE